MVRSVDLKAGTLIAWPTLAPIAAKFLTEEPDVIVVAVVPSLEAAEKALQDLAPTVGTVAFDLQGGSGLVLVTQARRGHPATRWVALGEEGGALELADAVVAGASGYVTKHSPATALVATGSGMTSSYCATA